MSLLTPSRATFFQILLLICAGLPTLPALAQSADGQRSQDRPGLALVKPQAWSKEDQATVLEFLAFTDRSGYYEFRTAKTPNYQVPLSRVVKLVLYPEIPQSVANADQRAALQKTIEEFVAIAAKFPSSTRHLERAVAPLQADAAKYDAGGVKESGQWVSRSAYYKQKAAVLADLLRPDLMAAPNIKDVDLSTNQYYLGLEDLARSEPSVKPVLEGARSLYDSLVRKMDRDALLSQLTSLSLGYEQSEELVKQLKALRPEEDARANLFIQSWTTAIAQAGQLTKQITEAQAQFEGSIPATQDPAGVPAITPEVSTSLTALSEAVKHYRSGSPPAAIQVPLLLADTMISCGDNFPVLEKKIRSREYFEAKSVLDTLAVKADLIGPKTSAALLALQKMIAVDIEKFQVLRNEGKMLAETDKIEQALKKYQQAYAIIPSKDVAALIDQLKKQ